MKKRFVIPRYLFLIFMLLFVMIGYMNNNELKTEASASDNSAVDTNAAHYVDSTQWVATDGLGRMLPVNTTTGNLRDKTVAMFYSSWHGEFAGLSMAYNNQQNLDIMASLGLDETEYFTKSAQWFKDHGIYTADVSENKYHFWDEPVFGYYDGDDEWVIRKHGEMLAAAGVDVIFFDNTNGSFTWKKTAIKIMEVFSDARKQGVNTPDVSFMFPFGPVEGATQQIVELYNDIYAKGLYSDVWYILDGKPMIMGWPESLNTVDANTKNTILNFFTFRSGRHEYAVQNPAANQWGWLSSYPQTFYRNDQGVIEQTTVGTAVNYNYADRVLAPMSGKNIVDRTWTTKGYDSRENAVLYGACFAEQWENALSIDPEIIFVSCWNEWVAMKLSYWAYDYHNCFVDQFDALRSRDIEPSNGILKDHYYYQLSSYIRQFKGTNAIEAATSEKTIDLHRGYGQWSDVGPTYNAYFGMSVRDSKGYRDPKTNKRFEYYNDTGRNDIYDAKVARDRENVYFMVRTVNDLTPYTDPDWMRLYINVDENHKGWEGYDFVLNKTSPSAHEAVLEKFTGTGYETEFVGKVSYSVQKNVLMVSVPKSMLGIPKDAQHFTLDFKWADNGNEDEDGNIMNWYSYGDVAPIGRFNYRYTTIGSLPYDGTEIARGWEILDLTNTDNQSTIQASLNASMKYGLDVTFDTKGMTLRNLQWGGTAKVILDYTQSNPRLVADNYKSVTLTYKTTDLKAVYLGLASGKTTKIESTKTIKVPLNNNGGVQTVTIPIEQSADWEGYIHQLALFYPDNQKDGCTLEILSIELQETVKNQKENVTRSNWFTKIGAWIALGILLVAATVTVGVYWHRKKNKKSQEK